MVLVGLASKNAILIVEFAKVQREAGVPRREATLAACRLRLRPIVMTSLAFILGVVPLMVSHGAGAEMRRTLGTAVFSGMLGVTLVGLFLTPVFFYVINGLSNSILFTSQPAHLLGLVLLDVTTLGLHRIVGPLIHRRRGRIRPTAAPNTNGQTKLPSTAITDAAPVRSASDERQPSDSSLVRAIAISR